MQFPDAVAHYPIQHEKRKPEMRIICWHLTLFASVTSAKRFGLISQF